MQLRRVIGLILVGLFLAVGCSRKRAPEGVLDKPQMVHALIQLYTQEERVQRLGLTRDSSQVLFNHLRPHLFAKLNTTDSTFRKSYEYYSGDPKALKEIYEIVIDSLNLLQQKSMIAPKP